MSGVQTGEMATLTGGDKKNMGIWGRERERELGINEKECKEAKRMI
jgi:hypothetical protein